MMESEILNLILQKKHKDGRYLDYHSKRPFTDKMKTMIELIEYALKPTDAEQIEEGLKKVIEILRNNNYPEVLIKRTIDARLQLRYNTLEQERKKEEPETYASIPSSSERVKRNTVKSFNFPLILVIDNAAYQKFDMNNERIIDYCKLLVDHMNSRFKYFNLQITLANVLIWSEKDSIEITSDICRTIRVFERYHEHILLTRDYYPHAQLITGEKQYDEQKRLVFGRAIADIPNTACNFKTSAVVMLDDTKNVDIQAATHAHLFALSLKIRQNIFDCPTSIKELYANTNPNLRDECTVSIIKDFVKTASEKKCLLVMPSIMFQRNTCGNGVKDPGEDCDNGQRDKNNTNLCISWTCRYADTFIYYDLKNLKHEIERISREHSKNKTIKAVRTDKQPVARLAPKGVTPSKQTSQDLEKIPGTQGFLTTPLPPRSDAIQKYDWLNNVGMGIVAFIVFIYGLRSVFRIFCPSKKESHDRHPPNSDEDTELPETTQGSTVTTSIANSDTDESDE